MDVKMGEWYSHKCAFLLTLQKYDFLFGRTNLFSFDQEKLVKFAALFKMPYLCGVKSNE